MLLKFKIKTGGHRFHFLEKLPYICMIIMDWTRFPHALIMFCIIHTLFYGISIKKVLKCREIS